MASVDPIEEPSLGDEYERRTLVDVLRSVQERAMPVPLQNPTSLPLHQLDPEVFERVMAEVIARQHNLGTYFYGRRGQTQYGLDIVERETDSRRSLYQVKRYQSVTTRDLDAIVQEYADEPRRAPTAQPPRRFDPWRLVIAISTPIEADTALIDQVAKLQDAYKGDLVIEAWGIEAISRKLRDAGALVNAVFGPAWAKAWCGFELGSQPVRDPDPMGLLEGPVVALHLDSIEADADRDEAERPSMAAQAFGVIADALESSGFPSHARRLRQRQAKALQSAGDEARAFRILFHLCLDRFLGGDTFAPSQIHDMEQMLGTKDAGKAAEATTLSWLARWYEHGTNLGQLVPALRTVLASDSPDASLLCCLALEQAVVDGIYDFSPPNSLFAVLDEQTAVLATELREMAKGRSDRDPVMRARLRCAVADASVRADASLDDVHSAFDQLVGDALGGRMMGARGLVASRAAYAYCTRGYHEWAENSWRQAIIGSSEERFFGDVRNQIRSLSLSIHDRGVLDFGNHDMAANSLPNRDRLLAGTHDPALSALENAHDASLPNALGDARRYQLESRLSGQLQEELNALRLIGDVLASGGDVAAAVDAYVAVGSAKKAVEVASAMSGRVDVQRWLCSPMRRRQAAAIQVIGAQCSLVPDAEVESVVHALIAHTSGLATVSRMAPVPEIDAVKAIAAFGRRIPRSAIAPILDLVDSVTSAPTAWGMDIANLLVQSYWAVEDQRHAVGTVIGQLLRSDSPPPTLWDLVTSMPQEATAPLLPVVTELAGDGNPMAVSALARWRVENYIVQVVARRACAALLRRPVGHVRSVFHISTQEQTTVSLLLALLETTTQMDVSIEELRPELSPPAGGVLMSMMVGSAPPPPGFSTVPEPPQDSEEESTLGEATPWPDDAATIASGKAVELATAVALRLVAFAEDENDSADSRSQAVGALRYLLPHLSEVACAELTTRLAVLAGEPKLSQLDAFEIASTTPFSRSRIHSGAKTFGAYCLLAACEAFQRAHPPTSSLSNQEESFVESAAASAVSLLREEDSEARMHGALTIAALSKIDAHAALADLLIAHSDEDVRSLGVRFALLNDELLGVFADDPSAPVRRALASRESLPGPIRSRLQGDTDSTVRLWSAPKGA